MSIVTQAMIERYALLRRLEIGADKPLGKSNEEGIRQNLEAWARGEGSPDARLTDSPETREVFAPLRESFWQAHGKVSADIPFSNVSFFDPDAPVSTVDGEAPRSGIDAEQAAETND